MAIIGCGVGGIATAVKLHKAGIDTYTIFEQSDGPGGTWWDNRYPGCEVDVPSQAYSFSFQNHDWTRTHASSTELQGYIEGVVDRFGVREHIRFSTGVASVVWDAPACRWHLTTTTGEKHDFDVVVSAVGFLNVPRYPTWPGLDTFTGPRFHTARWEEHDLSNQRVAIVGTGSTAAQVVPAIADRVGELLVFQREPGWVLPKHERDFTPAERARNPIRHKLDRAKLFYKAIAINRVYDPDSDEHKKFEAVGLKYIARTIADPAVQQAVTPSHPYGCKRPVLATTFYPALNKPNVRLVPRAVVEVTPSGVVDADGTELDVDVLVYATGFHANDFLATFEVHGMSGTLREAWAERARAYLGITVPGFPNFFIQYGPNTNGGWSAIAQLERQAEVAVRGVKRLRRGWVRSIDTRPRALDRWVRFVDRNIAEHAPVMDGPCNNYFHSESGANVTQWPLSHARYYVMTKVMPFFGLVGRR
ncbi:MAG TPA: NAD(P)/FAD-dependent oxidoreductase [Ilumatobacteraceae bacterium]|nr:NAD(P)/FAD-dependent oxidoreductase [Ilumatobacteraceae bacterium]